MPNPQMMLQPPQMMMQPHMQPVQPMSFIQTAPQFQQASMGMAPLGLPPTAPSTAMPPPPLAPAAHLDNEQKEFLELARARLMELPVDMRQKVQKLVKKEGAQVTKELHSAVKGLGLARSALEEALQARLNLLSSWRIFLTDAVKTWQDYAQLFQSQERDLQERIQTAQTNFAAAKVHADQSQAAAGTVPVIEIPEEDDPLQEDQVSAANSSEKIHAGLINLTSSLQQLKEHAESIEAEEKSTKRPRIAPVENDANMGPGDTGESKPPFVSPGCA